MIYNSITTHISFRPTSLISSEVSPVSINMFRAVSRI
nr:MAG TPA: hypothetical protein [Caudoviricetes sp.]